MLLGDLHLVDGFREFFQHFDATLDGLAHLVVELLRAVHRFGDLRHVAYSVAPLHSAGDSIAHVHAGHEPGPLRFGQRDFDVFASAAGAVPIVGQATVHPTRFDPDRDVVHVFEVGTEQHLAARDATRADHGVRRMIFIVAVTTERVVFRAFRLDVLARVGVEFLRHGGHCTPIPENVNSLARAAVEMAALGIGNAGTVQYQLDTERFTLLTGIKTRQHHRPRHSLDGEIGVKHPHQQTSMSLCLPEM